MFAVVVLEAVLTCLLGGAAGLLLGHAAVAAVAPYLFETLGIRIGAGPASWDLYAEVALGLLALGLLSGALPAWRALRTPVAESLQPVE